VNIRGGRGRGHFESVVANGVDGVDGGEGEVGGELEGEFGLG